MTEEFEIGGLTPGMETMGDLVESIVMKNALDSIEGDHPVWDMAQKYHRNEHDMPLRFDRQPYLVKLYQFWPRHPPRGLHVVVKKVPQEGISELALVLMFTYSGEFGARMFYVLPKYEIRNRFVKTRVDKSIAFTERYGQRMQFSRVRSDSLALKHFGRTGTVIFPSSNVANDFISFPVDIAVVDEVNKCDMKNVAMVDDRMAGFDSWRVRFDISTPTVKGQGISPLFDQSDQRHWFVKCDKCGIYQKLDWWEHVVERGDGQSYYKLRDEEWEPEMERDIYVFCKHCGEPMNRLGDGEWRATRKGRDIIGFHLSKLYSGSKDIRECWRQYQKGLTDPTEEQLFYNSYLGEDYSGGNVSFTDGLLDECSKHEKPGYLMPNSVPPGFQVCAGIDVGKVLHIWINFIQKGIHRAVSIGTIPNDTNAVDAVVNRLRLFNVSRCVIDADPETQLIVNLKRAMNTTGEIRLWSCRFQQEDYRDVRMNAREAHITVDRTYAFDQSLSLALNGQLLLPADWRNIDRGVFSDSVCAPVREKVETKNGPRFRWSSTDNDHYRLAGVYAWAASTLLPVQVKMDYDPGPLQEGRMFRQQADALGGFGISGEGRHFSNDGGRFF